MNLIRITDKIRDVIEYPLHDIRNAEISFSVWAICNQNLNQVVTHPMQYQIRWLIYLKLEDYDFCKTNR